MQVEPAVKEVPLLQNAQSYPIKWQMAKILLSLSLSECQFNTGNGGGPEYGGGRVSIFFTKEVVDWILFHDK